VENATRRIRLTGQQAQQGGFADAVWPHDADFGLVGDAAAEIAKNINVAKGLAQVVKR